MPTIPPEVEAVLTQSGIDAETASDPVSLSSAVLDSLPFMLEALTAEVKSEMGHQLVDTVPLCLYNGERCSMEK